ncbi:MAG: macro domain-containing protein [Thermoanaerobaculia bacterium]
MIEIKKGDILSADVEALVNTVNCEGVSGRGIALQFRKRFPQNFRAYAAASKRGEVQPGRMFIFETNALTNPRYIINFPTKRGWRGKSRIADIDSGLEDFVRELQRRGIRSVAIPPLGCGLGGLRWAEVKPRIERALQVIPGVHALLFEPAGLPRSSETALPPDVFRVTPGRAALVGLIERYLRALMDPFISLLEAHKLMYFLQEAGQPLRLRYEKALYGPFAQNLRHVLLEMEGQLLSGYEDGDKPQNQLELLPGAIEKAETILKTDAETLQRFERVVDLVQGFETSFGLELLSTVHWVASREGAASENEAVERAYAWSERKRRFSPEQIGLAWNVLQEKGWLAPGGQPAAP